MAEQTYLSRAPITEAILDFRADVPKDFQIEKFGNIHASLKDRYPKMERISSHESSFSIQGGRTSISTAPPELHGFFFKSDSGIDIAQFRRDGFTYNRLKPYTRWEEISQEALRLWQIYSDACHPAAVTRLAVRYINKIEIPLPANLGKYLIEPPGIPDGIKDSSLSYSLTRLTIQFPEVGVAANIIQTISKSDSPDKANIVIDIDVYKKNTFSIDHEQLGIGLNSLREIKNKIFFSIITDEVVRICK